MSELAMIVIAKGIATVGIWIGVGLTSRSKDGGACIPVAFFAMFATIGVWAATQ